MIWLVMIDANRTLVIHPPCLKLFYTCSMCAPLLYPQRWTLGFTKSIVPLPVVQAGAGAWASALICENTAVNAENAPLFPLWRAIISWQLAGKKAAFVDWVLMRAERHNINPRYTGRNTPAHAYAVYVNVHRGRESLSPSLPSSLWLSLSGWFSTMLPLNFNFPDALSFSCLLLCYNDKVFMLRWRRQLVQYALCIHLLATSLPMTQQDSLYY